MQHLIKFNRDAQTDHRVDLRRPGAIGKALIVWLVSGSGILAIIAYLVFAGAGC